MLQLLALMSAVFLGQDGRPAMVVTSEAELRAAAAKSSKLPALTVFIDRPITLSSMITFYGDSLTIVGVRPEAEIRFTNPWDCNWAKLPPQNGVEINANAVNIRGIKFTNFEWQGSTIKWNADPEKARLFLMDGCRFKDCGVRWCPQRKTPALQDSDTHHSNVVAAHELKNASFVICNCEFDHCGLSSQVYGHCLYVSARQISVVDCVFRSCGNPFQIGYSNHTHEADVFVSGNRVETTERSKNNAGAMLDQYLYVFGSRSRNVLVGNTFVGQWWIPMTGYYSLARDVVAFNDWRGSKFTSSFATDLKNSKYITPEQWRRFEFQSLWPATQPAGRR